MRFFLTYLLVAVLASAAVYWGAPYLAPYLARHRQAPASAGEPPPAIAGGDSRPGEDGLPSDSDASVFPRLPPAPRPSPDVPPVAGDAVPPVSPDAAEHASVPVAAQGAPSLPAAPEDSVGPAVSTDRIPASAEAGITAWGIAVRDADVALSGGRRNRVSAGTLFEETSTVGDGEDECAVGSVWSDGRWVGPVRIRLTDLFRVPGTRSDVSADDVDFLRRFYALKERVAALDAAKAKRAAGGSGLSAAERAAIDANPYAEEYRALYRRRKEFDRRAEALTEERDSSTGARRMKAADELRAMLHEQQALDRKIAEIDKKYKDWKKAHGAEAAAAAAAVAASDGDGDGESPGDARLRAEFESMRREAARFGAK